MEHITPPTVITRTLIPYNHTLELHTMNNENVVARDKKKKYIYLPTTQISDLEDKFVCACASLCNS